MSKNIAWVAVLLALLFETTIFAETPGLGFLIFWLATFSGTLLLLHSAERLKSERLALFLPSLLLAFAVFRFDAQVVRTWGSLCFVAFLAWAVSWNLVSEWKAGSLANFFPTGSWNPAAISRNAKESLRVETTWEKDTVLQVSRGLFLAAILLLVFGTLLAQADAVFGAKIQSIANLFGDLTPAPVIRTAFWLFLIAGGLRLWLLSRAAEAPLTRSFFGPTELYIALGSLNLLLFSFLAIQVHYLFGSTELVESIGMSHATYARRGFFELSLCIGLILPLVLVAYRSAEVNKTGQLRWLGGGLILSAAGLAISALKRMFLYISVYGLSVERVYAAAGIMVAMCILAWAAFACLSPRPISWLLTRQKLTVVVLLSLLGLVNVEAMVTRSHLELVESGVRQLDTYYLGSLSTDALPVMKEFEARWSGEKRQMLSTVGQALAGKRRPSGGVSFNISRHQAKLYGPRVTDLESTSNILEEKVEDRGFQPIK